RYRSRTTEDAFGEEAVQGGSCDQPSVAVRLRELDRLGEDRLGFRVLRHPVQGRSQLPQPFRSLRCSDRERGRAPEQADGRREIDPRDRSLARRIQEVGGAASEFALVLAERAELL